MSTQPSYRYITTDWHDRFQADLELGLLAPPNSYQIGLLNNATDDLQESADYGDITTEPGGGNYQQQSVQASQFTKEGDGTALRIVAPEITFNTVGAGQDVDSWFVRTTFNYRNSDADPISHLIAYGPLVPGGDRSLPDSGYYTVPLEQPDRYVLRDVNWGFDTSRAGQV